MAYMYYSSESSDSDNVHDSKALDLSYLMLDSDTLASYLRNSVREQCSVKSTTKRPIVTQTKKSSVAAFDSLHSSTGAASNGSAAHSPEQGTTTEDNKQIESSQDEMSQEEESKLEHKMESLSTEAVGQILDDSNNTEDSGSASSHKFEQMRSLKNSIVKSRNTSESDDGDILGVLSKDDLTEKLFLNHNLIINVPFELVLFHKLKFVDISNNNISHLNDFILHLPELQTLYLKNNQLENDGLPKDMSVLSKIREVNLSGNLLTAIPSQLYEIESLRYLYLGNNAITGIQPEVKALQNLQVLHLGGNNLTTVPEELGELNQLCALVLCNNKLRRLPRVISRLTKLRSLLLHNNNLCCLPVEIVKLRGLHELSLRDNPLVTRFVNSCAKELMFNPPSLKELAARTIRQKRVPFEPSDLPSSLHDYLTSGHKCVNPKCKGVYFTSCVEHIKFVDFCGMYRVPLMHYLCSSRCTSQTPSFYRSRAQSDDSSEDDAPAASQDTTMRRVLLG